MLDRIGRVDHRSAQGMWQMQFLTPLPRLAPFVRRINAYAERDTGFARRRELPTGRAVLLFNLVGELQIEDAAGNRTRFSGGSGLYSGPSRQYVASETDGAQEGVHIELTLPRARLLLGRPLEELGDRLVDPIDLLGAEALDLVGRLSEAPSQLHRLALLERMVEERLAGRRAISSGHGIGCRRASAVSPSAPWPRSSAAVASI